MAASTRAVRFRCTPRRNLRPRCATMALRRKLRASGTLLDAFVEIEADSEDARAQITARLTPFSPVPLGQLNADIAHFNPAAWFDDAPAMRLRGQAEPETCFAGNSRRTPDSVSKGHFQSRTWMPDRSTSSEYRCDQRVARSPGLPTR